MILDSGFYPGETFCFDPFGERAFAGFHEPAVLDDEHFVRPDRTEQARRVRDEDECRSLRQVFFQEARDRLERIDIDARIDLIEESEARRKQDRLERFELFFLA